MIAGGHRYDSPSCTQSLYPSSPITITAGFRSHGRTGARRGVQQPSIHPRASDPSQPLYPTTSIPHARQGESHDPIKGCPGPALGSISCPVYHSGAPQPSDPTVISSDLHPSCRTGGISHQGMPRRSCPGFIYLALSFAPGHPIPPSL